MAGAGVEDGATTAGTEAEIANSTLEIGRRPSATRGAVNAKETGGIETASATVSEAEDRPHKEGHALRQVETFETLGIRRSGSTPKEPDGVRETDPCRQVHQIRTPHLAPLPSEAAASPEAAAAVVVATGIEAVGEEGSTRIGIDTASGVAPRSASGRVTPEMTAIETAIWTLTGYLETRETTGIKGIGATGT